MPSQKFTDEMLVAFADGELDAKATSQIFEAIKSDEKLKQRVESYRQTAELLKETLGVSNEVTPDHIKFRIEEIEKKISSNELTFKAEKSNFLWAFLSRFKTAGVDFVSSHSIGGFAVGAACTLMIAYIAPLNLMQSETSFSPKIDQQIIMRGNYEASEFIAYVEQNGQKIKNEGALKANTNFKIILTAPIDGGFKVFFVKDGAKEELISGNAIKGELLNIPYLEAFDDDKEIVLKIEITNENSQFESTLKFIIND